MKGLKLQNLLSVKLSNVKHIFIIVIVSVGKCLADSCYMFTKSGKTFTENQNSCQDKGGDLVSMETEEEWTFINSQIQALTLAGGVNAWQIGLRKTGQNWAWVSGKPLTIQKWQLNQPSGDGAVVVISKDKQGLFDDVADESANAYICEIPKGKKSFIHKITKYDSSIMKKLFHFILT